MIMIKKKYPTKRKMVTTKDAIRITPINEWLINFLRAISSKSKK